MSHSLIAPSSAKVWRYCGLSVLMAQGYPETDKYKADADAGGASHDVASDIIKRAASGFESNYTAGSTAPNGVTLTAEMIECAGIYAGDVTREMRARGVFGAGLSVEQKIACPEIHELSFGTPDTYLYDAKGARLIIWDYKFGWGLVDAFENWQAINYFSGIADKLKLDGFTDQLLTVDIRIVQPRPYHRKGTIRSWVINAAELRPYVNQLATAATAALGQNPKANSGKWCRYCRGRHVCEAALIAGAQLYEASIGSLPLDVTPHALGVQLKTVRRAIDQLQYLETGYTEEINALTRAGVVVPGWGVVPTAGKEDWTAPMADVISAALAKGIDISKAGILTPNQSRAAGLTPEFVKQYSDRKKASYKLEPTNTNQIKEYFK